MEKAQDLPVAARSEVRSESRPPQQGAAKEVINTDGPIEGAEFRGGIEGRGARQPRLPDPQYDSAGRSPQIATLPEVGGLVLGEVKTVIVSTHVLDRPSSQGRIISKLREGDKVSVETRVGRWVRIRSRKGKTGYVFAQDVGELDDFSSQ